MRRIAQRVHTHGRIHTQIKPSLFYNTSFMHYVLLPWKLMLSEEGKKRINGINRLLLFCGREDKVSICSS